MLPVQYTPKHEVITFDNEIYIIDSDRLSSFDDDMETNKFIKIGDIRVAVSSIKTVRPAKQEVSMMERLLIGQTDDIKRKVREKVRERELEKKENTEGAIKNIIEYFTSL